jgi:type IX secretion system PorP/SprF family membrane protein
MKKQTNYIILVLAIVLSGTLRAQQLPMFSQYLFNGFLINPAYAGLDGYTAVNVASREQWLGLPGAKPPMTNIVSYQTRLLNNSFVKKSASARRKMMSRYTSGRVGVGGYMFNDRNGNVSRTGILGTYAYHIKMGPNVMSYGISGTIVQYSIDKSNLSTEYQDQFIDNTNLTMYIPDISLGAVYSTKTYYGGLSVDQLLQSSLKFGKGQIDNSLKLFRTFNLTGGYRYEIDKLTALEPSMMFKMTQNMATQVDLTCRYYFQRDYWVGTSFRTIAGAAIIVMGGVTVDRYHFGYSFDYSLSSMRTQNYGTHEFMIAYKFGDNASRLRWLNR